MNKRNIAVDVARGGLILYVITVIHGFFWLNLVPKQISSLLLFEMPLIFIVSGYAYGLHQAATGKPDTASAGVYRDYLLSRCSRILIPYFVYASICAVLCVAYKVVKNIDDWSIPGIVASWMNPFSGGQDHSFGMLNWHLWFVAPFLLVTVLLPWAVKIRMPVAVPRWAAMILGAAIIYCVSGAGDVLQSGIFYLLWAVFGYHMAGMRGFSLRSYGPVFALGLVLIFAAKLLLGDAVSLNMQANKFPPNAMFFLFSSVWASAILMTARFVPDPFVSWLAGQFWFRPFMSCGYSIFIWQGLGYTLASMAGNALGMGAIAVWLCAVCGTVIFGLLASPAERLRIRFRNRQGVLPQSHPRLQKRLEPIKRARF